METTDLLAIMAAVIYSAESAGNREADMKAAVTKAGDILKEVKEQEQAKKIG
jgi:hypothetical protein